MTASQIKPPVEAVSLRTLCSKTFDNQDGTFTLNAGVEGKPIHYKDGGLGSDEQWLDIDLSNVDELRTLYELTRSVEGIGYTAKSREDANESVSVTMLDVDVSKIVPARTTEFGVERILWPGALKECDIYMEPKPFRFGIFKVLKSEEAPRTFRFRLGGIVPSRLITPDSEEIGRDALVSKMIDGETVPIEQAHYLNLMLPPALAWDAEGNPMGVRRTLEGDVLTEQVIIPDGFTAWPVVVDTDVSYYSSTNDGEIEYDSGDYSVDNTTSSPDIGNDSSFGIRRFMVPFDTSGLPDNATISAATIYIYGAGTEYTTNFDIAIVGFTGNVPMTASSSDWNSFGSTSFATLNTSSFSASAYNAFSLNSSGISNITLTGTSKFGVKRASGESQSNTNLVSVRSADYSGTTRDPYITITYTVPASSDVSGSDTLSPYTSESSELTVDLSVSDTLTVATSESASVATITSKAGTDTMLAKITDAASLAVQINVSDTLAVTTAEASGLQASIAGSDTLLPKSTEVGGLQATLGVSDSLIMVVIQSAQENVSQNVSDALMLFLTDNPSLATSIPVTDALLVRLSDSGAKEETVVQVSVSDTLSVALTESAAIGVQASDTLAVKVTDSAAMSASVSCTDSLLAKLADLTALAASVAVNDTVLPKLVDTGAVQASLQVVDSVAVKLTDTGSLAALLLVNDTLLVLAADAAGMQVAHNVTDAILTKTTETSGQGVALAVAEQVKIRLDDATGLNTAIAVADTINPTLSDSSGLTAQIAVSDALLIRLDEAVVEIAKTNYVNVADTLAVVITDSIAVEARAPPVDDLQVNIHDQALLSAAYITSDSLFVQIADQAAIEIKVSDTLNVQVQDQAERIDGTTYVDVSDTLTVAITDRASLFAQAIPVQAEAVPALKAAAVDEMEVQAVASLKAQAVDRLEVQVISAMED